MGFNHAPYFLAVSSCNHPDHGDDDGNYPDYQSGEMNLFQSVMTLTQLSQMVHYPAMVVLLKQPKLALVGHGTLVVQAWPAIDAAPVVAEAKIIDPLPLHGGTC